MKNQKKTQLFIYVIIKQQSLITKLQKMKLNQIKKDLEKQIQAIKIMNF